MPLPLSPVRALHCKELRDVTTPLNPQRSQCLGLVNPLPLHSGSVQVAGPLGVSSRVIVTPYVKSNEIRGRGVVLAT